MKKEKQIIILIGEKKRFNHSNKALKQGKYKWKQKSKKENKDCEIDVCSARCNFERCTVYCKCTAHKMKKTKTKTKKFSI